MGKRRTLNYLGSPKVEEEVGSKKDLLNSLCGKKIGRRKVQNEKRRGNALQGLIIGMGGGGENVRLPVL